MEIAKTQTTKQRRNYSSRLNYSRRAYHKQNFMLIMARF